MALFRKAVPMERVIPQLIPFIETMKRELLALEAFVIQVTRGDRPDDPSWSRKLGIIPVAARRAIRDKLDVMRQQLTLMEGKI